MTTAPTTKAEFVEAIKASATGGDYTPSALKKKSLAALEALWAEVQKPTKPAKKAAAPKPSAKPMTTEVIMQIIDGDLNPGPGINSVLAGHVTNDGGKHIVKDRESFAGPIKRVRAGLRAVTALGYMRDQQATVVALQALRAMCDDAIEALAGDDNHA